jgi:hypothetical protein
MSGGSPWSAYAALAAGEGEGEGAIRNKNVGCTIGSGVGTTEQVTHHLPLEQRSSTPMLMLRPVEDHVAALAGSREVAAEIVRMLREFQPGPNMSPEC